MVELGGKVVVVVELGGGVGGGGVSRVKWANSATFRAHTCARSVCKQNDEPYPILSLANTPDSPFCPHLPPSICHCLSQSLFPYLHPSPS